ncbi:ATP-binding cassette domain-containing protein, partial [Streptomyces anulatus]
MQRLTAESVTLGYDQRVITENLSVEIPDNSFTVIVGPNACGKSTLLRALARMLKPSRGQVLLDGQTIHQLPAKKVARTRGVEPHSYQCAAGGSDAPHPAPRAVRPPGRGGARGGTPSACRA